MEEKEAIEKIKEINKLLRELKEFPDLQLELHQSDMTCINDMNKHYLYSITAYIERELNLK